MKKSKLLIFYCLLITLSIISCKEDYIIVAKAAEIKSERVVLIEDFTGVKCVNCPNATREIKSMISRYPNNVVAVAYHTIDNGTPITHPEEYKSKYNFLTDDGEVLEGLMGKYLGKPAVGLNRKVFDKLEGFILTYFSVLGNVEDELRSIPKIKISIQNTYDADTRKLKSTITIDPLTLTEGDFRMHALITESGIIDSQIDNLATIKDYRHDHVFRKMFSDLEGDAIGTTLTPGITITKSYEFTLPPEAGWWVANNCHVVAFVSDLSMKAHQVGAIVQAAESPVIE